MMHTGLTPCQAAADKNKGFLGDMDRLLVKLGISGE
jgi:hypothetical protein